MWRPSSLPQEQPRLAPSQPNTTGRRARLKVIPDHRGDDVEIAWVSQDRQEDLANFLPFPFQLYVLNSAATTITDSNFPEVLVEWIEQVGGIADPDIRCHFNIYRNRFDNILQCISHQRREIDHRNRNGLWPRLISSWTTDRERDYRRFILVIDQDDWVANGFIFVDFDCPPYDREHPYNLTYYLPEGDEYVARAHRHADITSYGRLLRDYWTRAGHTWTQRDLDNRNQGGFSPALYPAVDPTAHHDAEHEEDQGALHNFTTGHDQYNEDDTTLALKPVHQFKLADLWKSSGSLPELQSDIYADTVNWTITSVWNSRLSKVRPTFSFTIYLAADTPPFSEKAIFHCLDWGLLHMSTWTLDVVRVPDLESAFYHYTHETPNRTIAKTQRRQACARLILDRVAGAVLPEELLQYIESIIVPPAHPIYSFMLDRPFPGMFLYLDSNSQASGPTIVYTKIRLDDEASASSHKTLSRRPSDESNGELLISKLQHWRLVADELHTVWSMCSLRSDLTVYPKITLKLYFPAVCNFDIRFRPTLENMPVAKMVLTNRSAEPITIFPRFTPDLWISALDIDDVTEGLKVPDLESNPPIVPHPRWHSWSQEELVGYVHPMRPESRVIKTLYPGREVTFPMEEGHSPQTWWPERYRAGLFKNGHEYRVRIRDSLQISRWTFGAVGDLKGPYNLPPLPVHVENEACFVFKTGKVQDWMG